ncbi:MAG: hypothetical protein EXS55_02845 [Candidatus Magasanikbacteria bacterium]|nr:hypothetical protein [Candidatus Magasanikbacteria bacterium]
MVYVINKHSTGQNRMVRFCVRSCHTGGRLSAKNNKKDALARASTSILPVLATPADPRAPTVPVMQAARRVRTDEYACLGTQAPLSLEKLRTMAEQDGLPKESLFQEKIREGYRPAGSRRAVMLKLPPAQLTITLGGEDPRPPPKNRKP